MKLLKFTLAKTGGPIYVVEDYIFSYYMYGNHVCIIGPGGAMVQVEESLDEVTKKLNGIIKGEKNVSKQRKTA